MFHIILNYKKEIETLRSQIIMKSELKYNKVYTSQITSFICRYQDISFPHRLAIETMLVYQK